MNLDGAGNVVNAERRFKVSDEVGAVYGIGPSGRGKGAQLEDGFLKLANELAEAFACAKMSARETQVAWAVIRKTYGWDKKQDRISGTQLAELTGMSVTMCSGALNSLLKRRVLTREGTKFGPIGINTKVWQWKPPFKQRRNNFTHTVKLSRELHSNAQVELHSNAQTQYTITNKDYVEAKASTSSTGVDAESPKLKLNGKKRATLPNCPHETILALWAEYFPSKPQPKTWSGVRQTNLAARWRQGFAEKVRHGQRKGETFYSDLESGVQWWGKFLGYCAKQEFLRNGQFFTLGWLIKPSNFAKVIDGNYEGSKP